MNRNTANASSVIMAFRPTSGSNLSTINYSRMSVGVVQKYYKNTVTLGKKNTVEEKNEHVLAYVVWKKRHTHEDWFGLSATVTFTLDEPHSMCSFIPVQRIAAVCAHCIQSRTIGNLTEPIFIACPIPLKYCVWKYYYVIIYSAWQYETAVETIIKMNKMTFKTKLEFT